MRRREALNFRTPQHPSLGSNNWGGASPLLARNMPKESLEQRYVRINSTRTRDEIFPANDDFNYFPQTCTPKYEVPRTPSRRHKGILLKFLFPEVENIITLGSNSKKERWFPRWNPKNRWPQGKDTTGDATFGNNVILLRNTSGFGLKSLLNIGAVSNQQKLLLTPHYKSFIFKDFSDTHMSDIINGITAERYKVHLSE
ncbi:hypothetical protein SADUNF_Sadunf02G0033500 [Salix dunnii]|uniref:Uncharacterized protein n=1 Tax=Salix dunnii TaxID=1413687 RepID=A0A835N639_9ROSI|nr:hypothetical protein SADUNF_Sadunf02G0033500 [Salix dunnii]